jgi:hypothetical protein
MYMHERPDHRFTLVFFAIALVGLFVLWAIRTGNITLPGSVAPAPTPAPENLGERTETPTPTPLPETRPLGTASLHIGETARYEGLSIELLGVTSDSRCPEGVTCIWAGTLHTDVRIITPSSATTTTMMLGNSIMTDAHTITLTGAFPTPKEGEPIVPADYMLTFTVAPLIPSSVPAAPPTPPGTVSTCHIGGCSGEVCSDRPDMASNCIYREEFACYKKATCERQSSGACGWTDTPELRACLRAPGESI